MNSGAEKIYNKLKELHPNGMTDISKLSKNTTDNRDFIICDHQAFNFDLIKNIGRVKGDCKENKEKTPDALFLSGDKLFFVEFKEGDCDRNEIRQKIYEGITALYQLSIHHGIVPKDEFMKISIGYAVINRYAPRGKPNSEMLERLKQSIDLFNLKNIEGFIVEKTTVQFEKESILKYFNKITGGSIKKIEYVEKDGSRQEIYLPLNMGRGNP